MKRITLTLIIIIVHIYSVLSQSRNFYNDIEVKVPKEIVTYKNVKTVFRIYTWNYFNKEIHLRYYWDFDFDDKYEKITLFNEYSYVFKKSGNYNIKVRIIDELNNQEIVCKVINVNVIKGNGNQENIYEEKEQFVITNFSKNSIEFLASPMSSSVSNNYALLINTQNSNSWWDFAYDFYYTLKDNFGYSDQNIYFLNVNGTDGIGQNPNGIIDDSATINSVQSTFNTLSNLITNNDKLIIWNLSHGYGYYGENEDEPEFGTLYTDLIGVDSEESDYLENNFTLKILSYGSQLSDDGNFGLDQWGLSLGYKITTDWPVYRLKYLSSFTDLQLCKLDDDNETFIETVSDNDVFIEKVIDYLKGDLNQDGIVDMSSTSDEVLDFDGDGILPFGKNSEGKYVIMDEDDWGLPNNIFDNQPLCSVHFPDNWIIFDEDLDNTLDIDVCTNCSWKNLDNCNDNLNSNGEDINNDGLITGIDINNDNDKNDNISIDESISLMDGVLSDDDLSLLLQSINAKSIIGFFHQCFSGGVVDDLSNSNTLLMAASVEEWTANCCGLATNTNNSLENPSSIDNDLNGLISIDELFNSSSNLNHRYDDNGDAIYHSRLLPNGGDGYYGKIVTISDDYFCPASSTKTLSGDKLGVYKIEGAGSAINSREKLKNSSKVKYYSAGTVMLQSGFEVQLGSEFETRNVAVNCN